MSSFCWYFLIWPFTYWTLRKQSLETWSCVCCYCAYGLFLCFRSLWNISKKRQEIWVGSRTVWCRSQLVKVYVTDFFVCSIKSPQCTDKYSKKNLDSDFPSLSNFTSGGVQNRETKNRRLGTIVTSFQDSKPREKQISPTVTYFLINNTPLDHFLVNWLAHKKKMTEKSVFCEAWSPEMTSQSFPVSCFWSRGFVPHQKWNLMLLVHQNTLGEGKSLSKKNFCYTYQYVGEIQSSK